MTREEAIEKIRKMSLPKETMEILSALAPELHESEDEKMLKRIRLCLDECVHSDIIRDYERDECVAYLEKQKESLHISKNADSFTDEDERIRKEIIEFIQWSEDRGMTRHDFHQAKRPSEWIAYLEKQKPSFKQISDSVIWDSGLRAGIELGKQKEQKPVEKEITLTDFEGVLNTFLFDFANSSIEDCEPKEYIKKHSAKILKAAYKELNAKLQQDFFEAKQEGIREGYEAAKAEADRESVQKEQKPAEWSGNDKEMLIKAEQIVLKHWNSLSDSFYHKYDDENQDAESCYNWLKSLPERFNLEPKQEWNEEDEKMLTSFLHKVEVCDLLTNKENVWIVKRLKSLRPKPHTVSIKNANKFAELEYERGVKDGIQSEKSRQWKPSDGQMEALKECGECKRCIKELYEDLQKRYGTC